MAAPTFLNPTAGFKGPRKLRVACIGCGLSGMTFLQKATSDARYTDVVDVVAYEKNETVGGTWLENRYPGAACDVASHTYYLTCAPNPYWSTVFAPRDEIAQYLEDVAARFELKKYIRFDSKVLETIWDEEAGRWKLAIDHGGRVEEDEADFLVVATGFVNTPKWPDIPGIEGYQGKILHTAAWDRSYDYKGKRVAVLGNGASGIQAFAAMQPDVESITNYVRSPTWFSQPLSFEKLGEDPRYRDDEIKAFSEDPVKFKAYLKKVEVECNTVYQIFRTEGEINKHLTEACRKIMGEYMGEEFAEKFSPDFPAGCRRLTPGINYLKALNNPNATLSWDRIVSFTPTGIKTADGTATDYDLIVCATGFDRSYIPRWKMRGRDGADLASRWTTNDPRAFKSVWVEDVPNAGWIYSAPRAPTATGSIPRAMSFVAENVLSWLRKMSAEGIKSMVVRPDVVAEYNAYQDLLLQQTVFAAPCRSGYRNERGAVIGIFGGSMSSFILLQSDLHAECFDIRYRAANRFAFLGNGTTEYDEADPAWYMEESAELHRAVENSGPLLPSAGINRAADC